MHASVSWALFTMWLAVALGSYFEGATNVSEGLLGWTSDGSTILTFGPGNVGALNAKTGEQIWQAPNVSDPRSGHRIRAGRAPNFFYSADGMHLVSNCWWKSANIGEVSFCSYSPKNGELIKVVNTSWNRTDGLWPMAISPDGKHLAGSDYWLIPYSDLPDRYVRIWDADTGAIVVTLDHHSWLWGSDNIKVVAYSPDGKHLVSVGEDARADPSGVVMGMVSIWDLAKKTRVKLSDTQGSDGMRRATTLSFSPDGKYFATGHDSYEGVVRIWDVTAGKLLRRISAQGQWRIIWSPDGAKIATLWGKSGPDDKLGAKVATSTPPGMDPAHWYIHDVVTGACLQDIPANIPDWGYDLPEATALWSPDGSHFAWQSTFPGGSLYAPDVTGPIQITAFRSGNCTDPHSAREILV